MRLDPACSGAVECLGEGVDGLVGGVFEEVAAEVDGGGEGPADEECAVHEVDVGPVEGGGFAAAHAGAEHGLEQVGESVGVVPLAVVEERGRFVGCPAGVFGGAGLGWDGVFGGVVAQAPGAAGGRTPG
ncbi:hypothetical protein ABZ747_09580 [Kitasatospora cineracea]|uniref:hypothetical protein n=1 Tax=Kitasatospora cineracea TaxID=88074 RepID=UPI0033F63B92